MGGASSNSNSTTTHDSTRTNTSTKTSTPVAPMTTHSALSTSVSAHITTTTTVDPCFAEGVSWAPLDMPNTIASKQKDASACQSRCKGIAGCTHFSYFKLSGDCHLQNAYAVKERASTGFVSGPPMCWGGFDRKQGYVDVGHKTYLPKEIACLELGVTYSPIMGVPKYFPPDASHLHYGENSIEACQDYCEAIAGCEHFTVQFPTGLCRLSGVGARPLKHWQNAVSSIRGGCRVTGFIRKAIVSSKRPQNDFQRISEFSSTAVLISSMLALCGLAYGIFRRFDREQHRLVAASPDATELLVPRASP